MTDDEARTTPAAHRQLFAVVAGALLIVAVVALAGQPAVFTDTDDYYALGKQLIRAVVELYAPVDPDTYLSKADQLQAAADAHMGHTQMASRSAVYALFFYAAERIGSLWLVAGLQALGVAWPIWLLWRAALPGLGAGAYFAAVAAVALVSPLPFFAGFAMPDIFAGVAIVASTLLLVYPDRLAHAERWGLGALLAFAVAVHTSHVLFMIPAVVVAAVVLARLGVARRVAAARLGAVGAAVVVSILANAAYGLSVRLQTGDVLRNQPFLMARVLADGPGRDYLRHACARGERYALCAFAAKPLDASEDILWSDLPATGVFLLSGYDTRTRLKAEEPRFVLGTVAHAPGAQAAASLRNWGRQLALIVVDDPVRDPAFYLNDPYWRQTNLPIVLARIADCGPRGRDCASRLTAAASWRWHGAMLAAALAVAGIAAAAIVRRGGDRRLIAVVVLFAAGIALNAAVCGILSGPFARYQSRVIWLVPLAAALLVAAVDRRRGGAATRTMLL